MKKDNGAPQTDGLSQAEPEVSALRASIPSAARSLSHASALLASAFGVGPNSLTQFQARIRNLARLGILPRAGRGVATPCSPEEFLRLALATRLTLCGVAPEHAVYIVEVNRFRIATTTQNPVVLASPTQFGKGHVAMTTSIPEEILTAAVRSRASAILEKGRK